MSPGLCRLSKGGWLSRQPPPWAWLIPASVLCPRCLTGSAEWKSLVVLVPFSGWVCFPHFALGLSFEQNLGSFAELGTITRQSESQEGIWMSKRHWL